MNLTTNKHRPRLLLVDGLRGLAAAAVVVYHLGLVGDGRAATVGAELPGAIRTAMGRYGGLGVAVFFVISGFVTAQSVSTTTVTARFWGRYTLKRIVRLTPPYYVSIILAIAVAGLSAVIKDTPLALEGTQLSPGRLVAHAVYAQESLGVSEISSVFWTLCFEMMFYIVFVGLMALSSVVSRRSGRNGRAWVFVPAAVGALLLSGFNVQGDLRPLPWLPSFATFLLGVACYWAWKCSLAWSVLAAFAAAYIAGGAVSEPAFKSVGLATAVLLVIASNRDGLTTWLSWRPLQFLGRISYSWYLTHALAFSVVYFVTEKVFGDDRSGQLAYALLGVACSTLVAWFLYRTVEMTSMRWSNRIGRREPKAVIAGSADRQANISVAGPATAGGRSGGTLEAMGERAVQRGK